MEEEGQLLELVYDQNPICESSPMRKRGKNKGDVRRVATARGAMEKSRCVAVIEGKEVRGNDPIEYFRPAGVRSIF